MEFVQIRDLSDVTRPVRVVRTSDVNRYPKFWYTTKIPIPIGIWYFYPKFIGIFLVF